MSWCLLVHLQPILKYHSICMTSDSVTSYAMHEIWNFDLSDLWRDLVLGVRPISSFMTSSSQHWLTRHQRHNKVSIIPADSCTFCVLRRKLVLSCWIYNFSLCGFQLFVFVSFVGNYPDMLSLLVFTVVPRGQSQSCPGFPLVIISILTCDNCEMSYQVIHVFSEHWAVSTCVFLMHNEIVALSEITT